MSEHAIEASRDPWIRGAARLPWPVAAWYLPFWTAYVAWSWWDVAPRATLSAPVDLERTGARATALATSVLPVAVLLARFAGFGIEAAFYALWWRRAALSLPYWRMATLIMTVSVLDVLGETLRSYGQHAQGAPRTALALVCGISLLKPVGPGLTAGIWQAFGSLGLLTLGRIAGTAFGQMQALGRRYSETLILTAGVWLATRVVTWWCIDLLAGRSALP